MRRTKAAYSNRRNPGRRPESDSRTDAVGQHLDRAADLTTRGVSSAESERLVEIARLMRDEGISFDQAAKRLGLD